MCSKGLHSVLKSYMNSFFQTKAMQVCHLADYTVTMRCMLSLAHRALPDVEAVIELFTQPPLADCLPNLTIMNSTKLLSKWRSNKDLKRRVTVLISKLGTPSITELQGKRLDELGLDFCTLCQLRSEAHSKETFMEVIRLKGARSKRLREKLALLVHNSK